MSIASLRDAVTTAGGTPTQYAHNALYRELITAWGGTPTRHDEIGLLREAITAAGGTPLSYNETHLLRELVTALGGTAETYDPDALMAQVAGLASLGPSYGPELITNGTFDVDTSGWSATTPATLAVDSGDMLVTNNIASIGYGFQEVVVEIGATYHFVCSAKNGTHAPRTRVGSAAAGGQYVLLNAAQEIDTTFVPTEADCHIYLGVASTASGASARYDNVSLKKVL